ncbi:MAG: hypothetical protein ACHQM6_00670 [Candidatus Kapaibacterium sp.]
MPVNFKKLHKMDMLISSEPMTPEERAAFSAFLAALKAKEAAKNGKLKTKKKASPKTKSK